MIKELKHPGKFFTITGEEMSASQLDSPERMKGKALSSAPRKKFVSKQAKMGVPENPMMRHNLGQMRIKS